MKKINKDQSKIAPPTVLPTPNVKETVPKILLEIFLYGEEKDKKKISSSIEELSKQLNQARANKNKCRVLWYLDNGEKNLDAYWFLKSRYYCLDFPGKRYDNTYSLTTMFFNESN